MQQKVSPDDLKGNAVQVEGRRQRAEPAPGPSIDLAVNFEYASSKLTPDARIVLDAAAQFPCTTYPGNSPA